MGIEKLQENSYLADGNFAYIENLYDSYLKDPASVDPYWREQFHAVAAKAGIANVDTPLADIREYFIKAIKINGATRVLMPSGDLIYERNRVKLQQLIHAYRAYGHLYANLDPLDMKERKDIPSLHLNYYGFSEADFKLVFPDCRIGSSGETLGSIYQALKKTYTSTIGVEFLHIANEEEVVWIQERMESVLGRPSFSKEQKLRIYKQLTAAEGLEKYLGSKFVGQKRFSLEGATSFIPVLDELVQRAGIEGVKEVVMGMAHRGRLNTQINILGKSPAVLFSEFAGKKLDSDFSGDVKYHMGFSSDIPTPGNTLHLVLGFNPSHLEIINPVVEGSARARQERRNDIKYSEVVPVLIHGDAALAGQGVVAETLNFSQARGFCTGGTVHIVINNQIGFTTSNPLDARSTLYCTDVVKMVQAPVLHVNGDDPEACVFALQMAFDYRMRFKKDVMLDLICYRRLGHNEADEPSGTQPLMYQAIKAHLRTREIYAAQLIKENVLTQQQADAMVADYRDTLDAGRPVVELASKAEVDMTYAAPWHAYENQPWDQGTDTTVPLSRLVKLAQRFTELPENFQLQEQVQREYDSRRKMFAGEIPLNWGFAEIMAYATLATEGYGIRLCGQDCGRGTFSHRHAVLHHYQTGEVYIPLTNLDKQQKKVAIIDSVLSEEAVIGFEYGFAITDPETLVIWEAQFGDFANGAQVVIDQFISSGEQKWRRLCGLVMYLPHGYEGQGPEHSSARLERYLQLCAQNNIQVCVPTTPAQLYHMLRRQMVRPYRKPLIVMMPKSMLRHKLAVSTMEDLATGEFQVVIPEVDKIAADKVSRVILCAGKVYYDLLQKRREQKIEDIAIIRIEQLYPFPENYLKAALKPYKNAKNIIWCQEEPKNQGAWYSLQHHLLLCISSKQTLNYVGREASASPATGYTALHLEQQASLVNEALGL